MIFKSRKLTSACALYSHLLMKTYQSITEELTLDNFLLSSVLKILMVLDAIASYLQMT